MTTIFDCPGLNKGKRYDLVTTSRSFRVVFCFYISMLHRVQTLNLKDISEKRFFVPRFPMSNDRLSETLDCLGRVALVLRINWMTKHTDLKGVASEDAKLYTRVDFVVSKVTSSN